MTHSYGMEKQITHGTGGRILTNVNVWSPDSQWLVYDTRSDADGSVFDGSRIEMVNADTGQIRRLYESHHGANCGVATFNPKRAQVAFILGPENPTPDWQYGSAHRQGVLVDVSHPDKAIHLDARDITPPLTPGALRGGSHVHVFSPDGQWVSFTYNDALLSQFTTPSANHDIDQRNVAVSVPGHKVTVSQDNPRNHDGTYFTVLATRTTDHPRPGSDDITQALEEGWIGTQGYTRPDGTRQRRALAFQGQVTDTDGKPFWEVFVVDLPDDVTKPSPDGLLPGTMTRRPTPPFGARQRRLTHTAGRKYPGISAPRHWLRSSPHGAQIAFLMRDDNGVAQLWSISPNGSEPRQITHDAWGVASAFTWSPDGRLLAYAADNSIFIVDAATGNSQRLTARTDDGDAPSALACVFSPDGRRIAYQRRLADRPGPNAPRSNQIFVVSLAGAASSPTMAAIPAGQFVCGSRTDYGDEKPAHDVAITQAFSIASRPVSNAEFERFDPAHRHYRGRAGTASGDNVLVRFVTWNEANAYCRWLSAREGKNYRLPTEAEWEYAFRTAPDALRGRREVENWCADWYGPYPSQSQRNPIGYAAGSVWSVRGGTWRAPQSPADSPNVAARLGGLPDDRCSAIGLRVVLGPPPTGTALTHRPTPLWAKDVSQEKWDWKPTQERTPSAGAAARSARLPSAGSPCTAARAARWRT